MYVQRHVGRAPPGLRAYAGDPERRRGRPDKATLRWCRYCGLCTSSPISCGKKNRKNSDDTRDSEGTPRRRDSHRETQQGECECMGRGHRHSAS
ncbi:hypothetical protein VTO73DRAFT_1715 [Trametes versicolor]